MSEDIICISLVKEKTYVWRANDARILREKHGIMGALVGCLPRLPCQNIHLGLPLQLMPEEVTLLIEKELAYLEDNTQPTPLPTEKAIEVFKEKREKLFEEQVVVAYEERKKDIARHKTDIQEGKSAKRRRLLEEVDGTNEEDSKHDDNFDTDLIEIPRLHKSSSLIQIHTADPFKKQDAKTADWEYPDTPTGRLRYRAFKDLWENGNFLTTAGKFGGDFLVYPGDPSRFHSHYILLCIPYEEEISARELASMTRLGGSVKKTVVMCSLNRNDELVYTSVQSTPFR